MTLKKSIYITIGTASVLLIALLLIAGGYANGIVRGLAQRVLVWQLAEDARIRAIRGNPLREFRVVDVQIGDWVRVDTLDVAYDIWGMLRGRAIVHRLKVIGAEVLIKGSDDSFSQIALPVEIESLEIAGAEVVIDSTRVRDIALSGALVAEEQGYRAVLKRFRSVQFTPPLEVTNLSGVAVLQGGRVQLNDIALHTHNSRVLLSGTVRQLDDPVLDIGVEADSLWLADIRGIGELPKRAVRLRGKVQGGLDSLGVEALVARGASDSLVFHGVLGVSLFALRGDAAFEIAVDDLSDWGVPLEDAVGFDLKGQGNIRVDSSGVREGHVEGVLQRVRVGDARFDSVDFSGELADGLFRAQVAMAGPSGEIKGGGRARWADWRGDWAIRFSDVHAGQFPGVPKNIGRTNGRVNLARDSVWHMGIALDKVQLSDGEMRDATAQARYGDQRLVVDHFAARLPHWGMRVVGNGQGVIDPEPAIAGSLRAEVALPELLRTDRWGDSLTVAGRVDGVVGRALKVALSGAIAGNAAADRFRMSGAVDSILGAEFYAELSGDAGMLSAEGHVDGREMALSGAWQMDVSQLAAVGEVIGVDLAGAMKLSGALSGDLTAPGFSAKGHADSLLVAGVLVQNVDLDTRWARPDSGAVMLRIDHLISRRRSLRAVFLDAVYVRGKTSFWFGSAARAQDGIFLMGSAQQVKDEVRVAVDSLHIQVDEVALNNEGRIRFAYAPGRGVHIGQLVLSGPAGRLIARDQRDFQATVEVVLKNLDLRPWAFVAGVSGSGGILNGEMLFAGTLTDPLISGAFTFANAKVMGVRFGDVTAEMSFGNGKMLAEAQIAPTKDEVIDVVGNIPLAVPGDMHLRVRSEGIALRTLLDVADEKTKLAGITRSEGLGINTALNALFGASEGISGKLSLDLDARGRFDDPDLRGVIELEEGAINLSNLNRSYAPVSGRAVIGDGKIRIDNFVVGPAATLSGTVTLAGFLPTRWDLSAHLNAFEPVALPELQLVADGQLRFSGTPESSQLEGEVALKQAEIRLTELLEAPGQEAGLLDALNIHVQVSADRQVWMRDPTFEVEIAGDVDVIQGRDGLRIYGTLTSRRGNYILQNRRLRITQGEIQFQGRPGGNPNLNIRAETRIRAVIAEDAEPVDIAVAVGGTLTHPQVEMTSDPPLEGDIGDMLALLLTGRSVSQFKFSREGTLDLVLGVAANRLGQHIGQKLRLDLVEIDVGQGNISRVRLGKYIGTRLFMSYARDISSTANELAMEFEVLPGVTFEARQVGDVDEDTKNQRTRESVGLFWKKEW